MPPVRQNSRLLRVVTHGSLVLFAEMVCASPGEFDSIELRRCRTLSDDLIRLDCYDRATAADRALSGKADSASSGATAATAVVVRSAGGPASRGAPPVMSPPPVTEAEFGLKRLAAEEITAISSRVEGWFGGWSRGRQISLVNGQVWEVTDNTVGTYGLQAPLATVRRGMFDSYFLEIEGIRQNPKVRRVK
jgi:hypothetical protein